ncbi:MAG TPA: DUF3334 family protein, partial [Azonexus sp.]|nr:DUF3334 family protein [Azonexus sp.]
LSVDTNLDRPEARRVTFYTARNNIFYLELAIDHTEFIQINEFDAQEIPDPDALIAEAGAASAVAPEAATGGSEHDDLLRSLGM